jgi:hypothetical protein
MKAARTAPNIVRLAASQLKRPTRRDLRRLEQASAGPVDTSDIAELHISKRHRGPIRQAVIDEMRRQGLSGHRVWKLAREYCPRLAESAVYEFIANKRSVRVEYADALLQALGLQLTPSGQKQAG